MPWYIFVHLWRNWQHNVFCKGMLCFWWEIWHWQNKYQYSTNSLKNCIVYFWNLPVVRFPSSSCSTPRKFRPVWSKILSRWFMPENFLWSWINIRKLIQQFTRFFSVRLNMTKVYYLKMIWYQLQYIIVYQQQSFGIYNRGKYIHKNI